MAVDNKPNPATQAKKRWNASNYTQVKVSVRPEVAASFKAACIVAGVSMASELSRFMTEYAVILESKKYRKKVAVADYASTKKKRIKTVRGLIDKLENIRDAEEQAMENTPENFRGSDNFEAFEDRLSSMNEALGILEGLY